MDVLQMYVKLVDKLDISLLGYDAMDIGNFRAR